ncbi:MAG TPA: SCO family protein [Thermoanaerobaculia bacterium]|nr:SCO family protein [Thermoanaerobaculia bacterium]
MKTAVLVLALMIAGAARAESCHTHAPAAPPRTPSAVSSIPDVKVVTQEGKSVDFYSDLIKGKVVAVNFVFTTCTTVCPPLGAIFGKLQEQQPGARLISVSIDPEVDTPARLKAWSGKFGARPGWTLVTGKKDDIVRLLKAMNAYSPDFANHQPVTLVGNDATGTWKRSYGFTTAAKLAVMLNELEKGS